MGEHYVVIYVRESPTKQFTITARMRRARLDELDSWATQQGYTRHELGGGLDKNRADTLRDQARADYEARGYAYQPRRSR